MKFKIIASAIVFCLVSGAFAARVPLNDIQKRKNNKTAVSLFEPWGGISGGIIDTAQLHKDQKVALHDLVHEWVENFDLKWVNADPRDTFAGHAETFDPASVQKGLDYRKRLLALNPNIILIGEIRFYDAFPNYLPPNDPWWLPGSSPNDKYRKLDYTNPEFQQHVARKCVALLETGVVDGIFLDWATNKYLPFFQAVRKVIGDSAVIIGNTNHNVGSIEQIMPYLNGIFMECWWSSSWTQETYLDRIRQTIIVAERDLRSPKLICTEIWAQPTLPDVDNTSTPGMTKINPAQMSLMRAGVTAHYTLTSGYCTFYPKSSLGPNHLHVYDDFFNACLGKPTASPAQQINGAFSKEWENGSVVYNPFSSSGTVTVTFAENRRSQATGKIATSHTVSKGDGDIFLKSPYQQLYPTQSGFLSTGLPALRSQPDTSYDPTSVNSYSSKSKSLRPVKGLKISPLIKKRQVIIQKKQDGAATRYYTTSGRQLKPERVIRKFEEDGK